MEFYRSSAVGIALTKALNLMLESEEITMEDALNVLDKFDQSYVEVFRQHLHIRKDMESMEVQVIPCLTDVCCINVFSKF